jgi:putative membrane protein
MTNAQSDPRIYFAAERTLMAWLRTGLAVMAFGFVIARFGLFLQIVALQAPTVHPHIHSTLSAALGIALVAGGTAMIAVAAAQHRRYTATLPAVDLPAGYSGITFAMISSAFLVLAGLVLTAYLAASAD